MDAENLLIDEILKSEIIADEGRKTYPYKDVLDIWTAGVGHNLEAHKVSHQEIENWKHTGIPDIVVDQWFTDDLKEAIIVCREIIPSFLDLPDDCQRVLINMAFVLSYKLRKWHHLLAAISQKDWAMAAASIWNSRFANQCPNRCQRLRDRMRDCS